MEVWRLFLLLGVAVMAEAGAIIFPGQLDHAEGDACPANNGKTGICSRSCKQTLSTSEPRRCGVKDGQFLVCCDPNLGGSTQDIKDISPPRILFQCGINTRSLLNSFGDRQGDVLRPEAVAAPVSPTDDHFSSLRPHTSTFVRRSREASPNLPTFGIPPTPSTQLAKPGIPFPQLSKSELPLASPTDIFAAVGGVDAEENAWPWMALIGERDAQGTRWFCGGVLINDWWILTAGHCFIRNKADVVRLGEHNYNDDGDGAAHEDFGVQTTLPYPEYNFGEAYHDLALLRLSSRVNIKRHIRPVCLPWGSESNSDLVGKKTTLTGWGDTQFRGLPSSILQEVRVTVFPPSQCDQNYSQLPHYSSTWPNGIGEETLCAGDKEGGRDACQGDSGGPLVSEDARGRFVLAGIVSRGYGCGHKDYPGLYANLRYPSYLAWIKKTAFAS